MQAAGLVLTAGAVFSVLADPRVEAIFPAPEAAAPLAERVAAGQRSVFFGHHADYAAATAGIAVPDPQAAFDRATHYLLDSRLMMAWAQFLAAQGRVDQASFVAQRLREFRKADVASFFAECPDGVVAAAQAPPAAAAAASAPEPQCQAPSRPVGWRELLPQPGRR